MAAYPYSFTVVTYHSYDAEKQVGKYRRDSGMGIATSFADAAKQIEAENQRREQEIATANANLARQEKEIELKEREVAIKEKALEAEIKKTAEAKKYAEQQDADAKLYAVQKAAEADLFERQRQAEAAKIEAEKKAATEEGFIQYLIDSNCEDWYKGDPNGDIGDGTTFIEYLKNEGYEADRQRACHAEKPCRNC